MTNFPMYTSTYSPSPAYSPWERRRDALDRALAYWGERTVTAEEVVETAEVFDAFIAPRPAAEQVSG